MSEITEPLTRQDVVNRIREHFSQPDAVLAARWDEYDVSGPTWKCMYRGDGGSASSKIRCAVGCLIPDELYSASFEGSSAHVLLDDPTIAPLFAEDVDHMFLNELQSRHDQWATADRYGTLSERDRVKKFLNEVDAFVEYYGIT